MFDRDEALTHWRNRMSTAGEIRNLELAELESHLIDQAEDLQQRGLTEEESFLLAARRLGDASALGAEFMKTSLRATFESPAFWMVAGCLAYFVVGKLLWTFQSVSTWLLLLLEEQPQRVGWQTALRVVIWLTPLALGVTVFFRARKSTSGRWQHWFQWFTANPIRRALLVIGAWVGSQCAFYLTGVAFVHWIKGVDTDAIAIWSLSGELSKRLQGILIPLALAVLIVVIQRRHREAIAPGQEA